MYRKRYLIALLICIWIASLFAGCQSTGRTAGEFIDDVGIAAAVQAKIFDDDLLRSLPIKVTSYQGEVTLTGAVNSRKAKNRAEKLAYSVKGVRRVNNHLKVQ
ncbi:MAG: BON domain-containing protein [Spirochaetes bacterium]|nr:BON domain-containing protein [Spirochaetota bacterium]